jgi:hypothetical protein
VNHFARRKDYDYSLVFNATFNNISAISLWAVLLVDETVVPGENHRTTTSR